MEIILKHSNQTDLAPAVSELEYGELAVNYAAGKEYVYLRNDDDEIVSIPITKIVEIDGILSGTSSAISDLTYFNKGTNRIETYVYTQQGFPRLDKTYNLSVSDILYDKDTSTFYLWDGTNELREIVNNIPIADDTTAGIVMSGGNVNINNGVISVDQAGVDKLGLVKGSDENQYGSLSGDIIILSNGKMRCRDGILRYHRLDWLDSDPEYLTFSRYKSLKDIMEGYDDSPKLFVKNGCSAVDWNITAGVITLVFMKENGDGVLKTTYTVKVNQENRNYCIVEKSEAVDNDRVLNYDGLNLSNNASGQITDEVNGANGLFEMYELLSDVEKKITSSEPIYKDYYGSHYNTYTDTTTEAITDAYKTFETSVNIDIADTQKNPSIHVVAKSENDNVLTEAGSVKLGVYKNGSLIGTELTPTANDGDKWTFDIDLKNYVNSNAQTTFTVKFQLNAKYNQTPVDDITTRIKMGIYEIQLSSYTVENVDSTNTKPSFAYNAYTPLNRPTLTVQYTDSYDVKHVVTYNSFYSKAERVNDTSYAIGVAEGVSSVFGWIFSNYKVNNNGWKFAIGNSYSDVKSLLIPSTNNTSGGAESVEPGISGGGDTPGQSGQGEVRP